MKITKILHTVKYSHSFRSFYQRRQDTFVMRVLVDPVLLLWDLLAVNYDPATTDLSFFRVNIYPGPREGGLELIFQPIYFIRVTINPAALHPTILAEVTFYSGAWWMLLTANFPTYYFTGPPLTQPSYPTILAEVITVFTLKELLPCFGFY